MPRLPALRRRLAPRPPLLRRLREPRRLAALGVADAAPLSWRERLAILCGVAQALLYLHTPAPGKPQTLHRDVKPGNVLLVNDAAGPRPLLADTGLAKAADGDVSATMSHLTTARVLFTPGFEDPLSIGSQHSAMTDAFAFGVTALVALTGQPALDRKAVKILERLIDPLEEPSLAPTVADAAAAFPDAVATAVMEVVVGLSFERRRGRRSRRRRRGSANSWRRRSDAADAPSAPPVVRECIICEDAPREVRRRCVLPRLPAARARDARVPDVPRAARRPAGRRAGVGCGRGRR